MDAQSNLARFAWSLRAVSVIGAIPSVAGALFFGWQSFYAHFLRESSPASGKSDTQNVLIRILESTVSAAHTTGATFTAITDGIMDGLFLLCAISAVIFLLLFRTARSLGPNTRGLGVVVLLAIIGLAGSGSIVFNNWLIFAVAAVYSCWGLWSIIRAS